MFGRSPVVTAIVAAAVVTAGCSSSRNRSELGAGPTPPTPVYASPVEQSPQSAYRLSDTVRSTQPYHPAPPSHPHVVRPGESLYDIARHHRVSVAGLIQANRLPSTMVSPGQQLVIPR